MYILFQILSGEVERAERALSVVTFLLGHTSEIGKQLRDVESQLNK
jgi:hypothetical protein